MPAAGATTCSTLKWTSQKFWVRRQVGAERMGREWSEWLPGIPSPNHIQSCQYKTFRIPEDGSFPLPAWVAGGFSYATGMPLVPSLTYQRSPPWWVNQSTFLVAP
jgi:hypothetical protein